MNHSSGADWHRRMQRHPLTDPKPEPAEASRKLPPPKPKHETRKQRRLRQFGEPHATE